MDLSYAQLESALASHLEVHPEKIGTFRARVKQLQRLQFPPGVNVGRGTKMLYSGAHLFQMVTAFELIALGLPGLTATSLVTQNWQPISAGFALAIKREFRSEYNGTPSRLIYLRIEHNSLINLEHAGEPRAMNVHVYVDDLETIREDLEDNHDRTSNRFILLCASHIMRSVLDGARRAKVENPEIDDEFARWLEVAKSALPSADEDAGKL